jgi:hypothetical protein
MAPVEHVIPVVDRVDGSVIGFIPGAGPVFRLRINLDHKPHTGIAGDLHDHDWHARNTEPLGAAETGAETVFRNAVTPVAPAFPPAGMFMLPMLGDSLPNIPQRRCLGSCPTTSCKSSCLLAWCLSACCFAASCPCSLKCSPLCCVWESASRPHGRAVHCSWGGGPGQETKYGCRNRYGYFHSDYSVYASLVRS